MHSRHIPALSSLALLLFLLFVSPAIASEAPPVEELRRDYPYAELSTPLIEMGDLKQGAQATGTITLTNTGSKPLLISTVRSSCGLMTPSWPRNAVEPGKQVNIQFRYDAARIGPFERIITIHTNSFQKTLKIRVTGTVWGPSAEKPQ